MADVVSTVRNAGQTATYHTLRPRLIILHTPCYRLGLDMRRVALENMVVRSDTLIREGGSPALILQLYTDWIPDPRSRHAEALKSKDRAKMENMWKAQGGHSGAALLAVLQSGWGGGATSAPARGGPAAQPSEGTPFGIVFPSSTPQPAVPQLAASLGSLTLPLSKAALGQQGAPAAATGRSGKKGKKSAKARGVPTNSQAQEWTDYNIMLKATQQAALPHPGDHYCTSCAGAGRNPHHWAYECAYEECGNCSRGGPRVKHCMYPKWPYIVALGGISIAVGRPRSDGALMCAPWGARGVWPTKGGSGVTT